MAEEAAPQETPDTAESVQADQTTSEDTRISSGAQLTQTEVDRIVESRLARERRKYEGFEEYQQKAQLYDEAEAANKSELEKVIEERDSLESQVAELASANQYVAARNGLLAEVAKPDRGIVDPEGAVEFLLGADIDLVEFDEDGTPLNAAEAVNALAEKRSYLVAAATSPSPSDADLGARGSTAVTQLSEADLQNMPPREIVEARNNGQLDDVLKGHSR